MHGCLVLCGTLRVSAGERSGSDQDQASAAGFDACMTKPVDTRRLAALLDELLAAKRH